MNSANDYEELNIDGTLYPTRLTEKYRRRRKVVVDDVRAVRAAVPGRILAVNVKCGDAVRRGQGLLVLEAMKMENTIMALTDGAVAEVHVSPGALVARGDLLLELGR